jgi:hypothetical protein
MRSLLLFLVVVFFTSFTVPKPCYYKSHPLTKGSKGGCYYINKNGNKTYVDRSYCNC